MRAREIHVALLVLGAAACAEPFDKPMKLGGAMVPAETLNQGHAAYQQYCRPCHGDKGDGKGYSSYGLRPPPRDFTQGLYKFGGVAIPALPPDSELKRIVRGGLHGTAMLPWEVPDKELSAILQYIKTFAPHKWGAEEPGKPVEISADPYGPAKRAEALKLGEQLFHAKAQCMNCHPAFVTHEELWSITKEVAKAQNLPAPETIEFNPEMYHPASKQSDYCLKWKEPLPPKLEDRECALPVMIAPPDFTRDAIRTVTMPTEPESDADRAKRVHNELYRTIAAGIGGAGMPTWKGALTEPELWALVYYVENLINLPAAEKETLRAKLGSVTNLDWKVPAAVAPPTEGDKGSEDKSAGDKDKPADKDKSADKGDKDKPADKGDKDKPADKDKGDKK